MTCPECRRNMVPEQHSGLTLDRCVGCQSLWFDAGELESYLQTLTGQDRLQDLEFEAEPMAPISADAPLPPPSIDCPSCETIQLERGKSGHIELSRCGHCRGIYVSGDEALAALTGGKLAGKKSTLRAVGDVAETGLMIFSDLLIEIFG